jgi:hypothetical protein
VNSKKPKKPAPLIREDSRINIEGRLAGSLIVNAVDALSRMPTVKAEDFAADPTARQIVETASEIVATGKASDELAIMAAVNLPSDILQRYVDTASPLKDIAHYADKLHGMAESERLMKKASPLIKNGDAVGLGMLLQDYAAQMPCVEVATVANDWLQEPDEEIHSIVNGLIDAKNRVAIVGQSKAKKSWFALQLAISLVSGAPFLGMQISTKKRVLLINGEIDSAAYKKRLRMMLKGACVASEELAGLIICNTSEDCSPWDIGRILAIAKGHHVDVVIVDPFYLLIDDEIDQTKVKECVRLMKRFASSGIALVSVFHATKGRIGDKQTIDRIAGSGIFARDCSTLVSLCEHASEPDHVVMACEIRNHPPMAPSTLLFSDGCFHLADGVAAIEKTSSTKPSRKFDLVAVAKCIDRPMTYGHAVTAIKQSQGIGDNKAKELLSDMVVKGLIVKEMDGLKVYYRFNEV